MSFPPPTSITDGLSADDDLSLVTLPPPPEDLLLCSLLLLLLPPRWSIEFFLWQSMQKSRNLEMASRGMKAYWSATCNAARRSCLGLDFDQFSEYPVKSGF